MGRPRRRSERGAATAELVMVLPALVVVTIGLVWLLSVGTAQVRAVDAARETARMLARGDDEAAAIARGQQVAPGGSRVTISRSGDEIRVTVLGEVAGPGGALGFLPGADISAEATTVSEQPR